MIALFILLGTVCYATVAGIVRAVLSQLTFWPTADQEVLPEICAAVWPLAIPGLALVFMVTWVSRGARYLIKRVRERVHRRGEAKKIRERRYGDAVAPVLSSSYDRALHPKPSNLLFQIAEELARYEMRGPLPTTFKVAQFTDTTFVVRAIAMTPDRETERPTQVQTEVMIHDVELRADFTRQVRRTVQTLTRQLWEHERREWLRYDGVLVDER